MSAPMRTLGKRPAAWRVGDKLLCELQNEEAIERFGIDRYPIVRVPTGKRRF